MKSKKPAKRKKRIKPSIVFMNNPVPKELTATEAAALAESSKFKGATYDGIVMDEFANRYSWDKMYDEHRAKRDAAMVYLDNLMRDAGSVIAVEPACKSTCFKELSFKIFGWSIAIWK